MSRTYLLQVEFDKDCDVDTLRKIFNKWCGKDQVYAIHDRWVTCEMGCSGGIAPEDTMTELWKQLNKKGIPTRKSGVWAWSLHPDNAIRIGGDEDGETNQSVPKHN